MRARAQGEERELRGRERERGGRESPIGLLGDDAQRRQEKKIRPRPHQKKPGLPLLLRTLRPRAAHGSGRGSALSCSNSPWKWTERSARKNWNRGEERRRRRRRNHRFFLLSLFRSRSLPPPQRRVVAADLVRARNVYGFHATEELFVKLSFAHPYDVKRASAAFAEGKVRAPAVVGGGERAKKRKRQETATETAAARQTFLPLLFFPRVPCFEAHIPYVLQFKADCGLAGMDVAELERGRVRGGWPRSGPRRKWWQRQKEKEEEKETAEEDSRKGRARRRGGTSHYPPPSLVWTSGSPHAASWELPWPAGCGEEAGPARGLQGRGSGTATAKARRAAAGTRRRKWRKWRREWRRREQSFFFFFFLSLPSVIEVDVTADAIANAKAEAARRVPLEAMPGLFDEEEEGGERGSAFPSSLSSHRRLHRSFSPPLPALPRRRAVASLRPMWRDEAARCPGGKLPPPPRTWSECRCLCGAPRRRSCGGRLARRDRRRAAGRDGKAADGDGRGALLSAKVAAPGPPPRRPGAHAGRQRPHAREKVER